MESTGAGEKETDMHDLVNARIAAIDAMEECRYAAKRGGDVAVLANVINHIRAAHYAEYAPTHRREVR